MATTRLTRKDKADPATVARRAATEAFREKLRAAGGRPINWYKSFGSGEVEFWAVAGRALLLQVGEQGDWDAYVPLTDSNRTDATHAALDAWLARKPEGE